jgi:small subunit ribosomal protein S2
MNKSKEANAQTIAYTPKVLDFVNQNFGQKSSIVLSVLSDLNIKEEAQAIHIISSLMQSNKLNESNNLFMKSIDSALTLDYIMDMRVHLGHRVGSWDPRMAPYIYGSRNGYHILDINKTIIAFKQSLSALRDIVSQGGRVLFVGTRPNLGPMIVSMVPNGHYYISNKWLGGIITNWGQFHEFLLNSINQSQNRIKQKRLKKYYSGFFDNDGLPLNQRPDCIVFIHVNEHSVGLKEAYDMNIPTIGIVDTDCNPHSITFAVPGNDDSTNSQFLYMQLFCETILSANKN